MVSRSINPTVKETFAPANYQPLEAAMQRATASPLAELDKRFAAMQHATASPLAELDKRFAAMQHATASPLAELDKRFAAMQHATASPLAELDKRFAAMQRATASPLAELDKRFAAMQHATASPLAELDKRFAAMQRATASPLAELDKRFAAMQRATASPLAELDKRFAAMQRATASPLAELDKRLAAMQRGSALRLAANIAAANRSQPATEVAGALTSQKAGSNSLVLRRLREYPAIREPNAPFVGTERSGQSVRPEIWLDLAPPTVAEAAVTEETRGWWVQFDIRVTDVGLHRACRSLFISGHYTEAVRKAFTYIDNMVRHESGQGEKHGADLMHAVFSANKPLLKVNDLKTRSDWDEQKGYMEMFAGAMSAIRNPRSHEHAFEDSPEVALELLGLANHFMRVLNRATPT